MKRQPTSHHLTWILDLYRNNQLDLDPPYQRKSVWTPKDRRFFLDTIFRNYPTPPIFVHRSVDDNGFTVYHVVDGKQRLETILSFAQSKLAIDKNFGDENLDGKKFKELTSEYKRKFWDYVLVVDFIESIEGTNIEEVFDRVNRNSKNLQPQELRHARFDGWFIKEAENESEETFWWDIKVSTRSKDRRMKNVQFISELLLMLLENEFVGFNQDYIDKMYAKYDELEEDMLIYSSLDEYSEKKKIIKSNIINMNNYNSCIDLYCKTGVNQYTLWSFFAFNDSKEISVVADLYSSFMKAVESFVEAKTPEDHEIKVDNKIELEAFKYYKHSKGATTELPQRIARYDALTAILKGK